MFGRTRSNNARELFCSGSWFLERKKERKKKEKKEKERNNAQLSTPATGKQEHHVQMR
jgi:hypothetical protein